jgi:hypothetical protein
VKYKIAKWDKWWMGKTFPVASSRTVVDSSLGCSVPDPWDNCEYTTLLHTTLVPNNTILIKQTPVLTSSP